MTAETTSPVAPPASGNRDVGALVDAVRRAAPGLGDLFEVVPSPLLLLDGQLRILLASAGARALARGGADAPLAGLRPGEALGCVRAVQNLDICIRDPDCAACGANRVLALALAEGEARGEWQVLLSIDRALETREFDVHVRRLDGILPEPLWVASLREVGEERRKEALQRLFFHDVLNVTGGIRGLTQLIPEMGEADRDECLSLLDRLSMQLTDMIGGHRDLLWAEKGDLQAVPDPVALRGWMDDLVALYLHHPVAENRRIALDAPPVDPPLVTDGRILSRVVGNLLKNALEACAEGETVTLAAVAEGDRCRISVHNPAVMAPEVQGQLFQRSFSTKAPGRGLGTYSARLLTERCLAGTLGMSSGEPAGTVFTVDIPLQI
ncbi:MAG: sensor histidine kinase [Candidatus Krumholzibacteriia bacterium]